MKRLLLWKGLCSVLVGVLAVSACTSEVAFDDDSDTGAGGTGTGGTGTGGTGNVEVEGPSTSDKVDILLVVDNSRGVAHMQDVLSASLPTLISGVAAKGVTDLHVGVLSSSLGGLGADACSGASSPSENDHGRLISRSATGGLVPTYDNLGFLAWDPNESLSPPGETNVDTVIASAQQMVLGAGDEGCGYESPLEAFYRFLIDPDPYENVGLENGQAVLAGTDATIMQQRADFVRPDSLLMIVIATDENDCSTRDGGQFYFARQIYQPGTNSVYHMPKPRAACAADPNDPCCRSCGQAPGDGCDESADDCSGSTTAIEDNINLRCFDQKRRFGIDFLWPIDRYTQGLGSAQVVDRHGNVVTNPLFTGQRGSALVVVSGIVGVPWQLVSRGGDASNGALTGGEIAQDGGWAAILGDPANYVPPSDPHMIESIDPRGGIPGPNSAHDADPYNGHDFSVPQRDDLQYACVWNLPQSVDCTGQQNCECADPGTDNPVCQDPADDTFGTQQYRALARPGIRPLQVLESLGDRAVVGSICPAQIADSASASFGFKPVFATLLELAEERIVD